jgi:hypothetical protein
LRADRLDALQADAAPEHRGRREQAPCCLAQQVIAPGDRGAQGALPVRRVLARADQQAQRVLQPRQDRLRRQQLDPRGRQLDRQRQAVEPLHDPRDRPSVLLVDGEPGHQCSRPRGEQLRRLTRRDRGDRRCPARFRHAERGHSELLLARRVQRRAARDQGPQLSTPGKELLDELTRREHVLEVVQHQQEFAISQVTVQVLQQRSPRESCSPMPWAIETATNDASLIAASGTKRTPPGKAPITLATSAMDNLVLPQPPGPVRVSSLLWPSRYRAWASSLSLPTKLSAVAAAGPAHPGRR